jgi:predicted ATPase
VDGGNRRIVEVVLTGGACGGKTTALGALAHLLRVNGYQVITVPEAFTMIVSGGVSGVGDMVRADGAANCDFQHHVFTTIRRQRDRARGEARKLRGEQPVVIVYDRGELDAMAFHDHECFDRMAGDVRTTINAIRDSYHGVMHLVTTADGADGFYNQLANDARWETVDEAKASDQRLFEIWKGHPRHFRIDNSTDFGGKMRRLLEATLTVVENRIDVSGYKTGVKSMPSGSPS